MMTMPSGLLYIEPSPAALMHGALSQWLHIRGTYETSTMDPLPRVRRSIEIHSCPCAGCRTAYPGKSLPTCSSFVASTQLLQPVHLATSTIKARFFMRPFPLHGPISAPRPDRN